MSDFSNIPLRFNKIAAVKTGNPALALLVSIELQKPCVFVDVRGGAISSDSIDGELEADDEVIIIHDVVASGQIILLCASELTKQKAKVNHVFALLERTDRKKAGMQSPSEFFRSSGLVLHTVRQLDDKALAKISSKPNQTRVSY
jgi:orotate phosphoribosyltransferase